MENDYYWNFKVVLQKQSYHTKLFPHAPCQYLKKDRSPFSQKRYYDYQLSNAGRKFVDQVLRFKFCCCHEQLALSPVASFLGLVSIAAECAKLRATILLPLETRKVARGNTIISSPNFVTKTLLHLKYSTDNLSTCMMCQSNDPVMANHVHYSIGSHYITF